MYKQALTFDDILLVPKYTESTSRKDTNLTVTDKTGVLTLDLPIFSANMDTITESSMAKYIRSQGGMGVLHRFMSIEKNIEEYKKFPDVFVSVGVTPKETERFYELYNAGANKFCVDIAHGHSKQCLEMVHRIRQQSRDNIIIAGNVATAKGVLDLKEAGANLVKVGIGPGSVCSTRIKTGFGIPQLTAIQDCSNVLGISIIADGGIKTPGDIVKALAFGADFVMLGGMLAGTEYTPGEIYWSEGQQSCPMKSYRGMASKEAADDYLGGLTEWKTAEGVSTTVPLRSANEVLHEIKGGLRSGLTYGGATNIKELQRNMEYVIISNNGLVESKPHKLGL